VQRPEQLPDAVGQRRVIQQRVVRLRYHLIEVPPASSQRNAPAASATSKRRSGASGSPRSSASQRNESQ
jgi:hypothetical protein